MAKKYWWEEDESQTTTQKQTQAGQQPQNQGKKTYWWEPESVATTIGGDIVSKVNSWIEKNKSYFSDYQNRFSGRKGNYEDAYVSDSASWMESFKEQGKNLNKDAQDIIAYVDQYKDYLDADWVDNVKSTLNSTRQQYWDLLNGAKNDNKYWSKWESEDDYKKDMAAAKDYEAKSTADLNALSKELENLDLVADEFATVSNQYFAVTNNPSKFSQEQIDNITAKYFTLVNKYGNPEDFHATRNEKKLFLADAKRIQEGITLSGVMNNEDFKANSGYVSTEYGDGLSWDKFWNNQYGLGYEDLTYEYINGAENGMRSEIRNKYESYSSDPVYRKEFKYTIYDQMNEDEIAIYNYYYTKDGKEAAQKYLDNLQYTLNAREATAMFSNMEDHTLLELAFGVAAGLDQFKSGMEGLWNAVTGDDEYKAPSSTQMASGMVREDLKDVDLKWYNFKEGTWGDANIFGNSLGQTGYDAVTTTSNMLPSILTSAVANAVAPGSGAVLGTSLLGSSAGGNAYQEMINLGYDKGQARAYAVLVGGSEAILQYALGGISSLSGGSSEGIFQSIAGKWLPHVDKAFARVAIQIGSNMLDEGLEEGLQEILTPWFKNLTLQTNESVNWSEVAYSSLLGALTAGLMEGPTTIAGEVNTYKTGKKLQAKDISAQRLAEIGKTFSADTVAYQLADKVNENTGAYTMGRLFNEIGATLTTQNVNEITTELMKRGMDAETAKANAEALAYVVEGGQLSAKQIAIIEANDVLASVARSTLIDANTTWNQRSKGYNDMLKALAEEMTSPKTKQADTTTTAKAATEEFVGSYSGTTYNATQANLLASVSTEGLQNATDLSGKQDVTFNHIGLGNDKQAQQAWIDAGLASIEKDADGNEYAVVNDAMLMDERERRQTAKKNAPVADTIDAQTKNSTESLPEVESIDTNPAKVHNITDIKKKTIKLEDGSEVNVKDADLSPDDGVRIETIASIDGISTEDANFILNTLRTNTGASAQMDSLGAKEAFKYGFYGLSQDHMTKHGVFANSLTETQRQAIYDAGKKARQKQIENASPKTTSKERGIYFDHGNGNVVAFKDADKSVLAEDKRKAGVQAAIILHKLGIGGNIYFFESYRNASGKLVYKNANGVEKKAPNGWYSESDGSIHIDLNAGVKGDGLVLFTLAHELTHFIEKWSPQKYKVLADFLIENYEKGQSMDKLVRAKQTQLSATRNKRVSYDEAYSEVIADSMEAMLADGNVMEKILELKAKDEGLVAKIKQFFDNLLVKIRNAYEGLTPDSAEGQAVLAMTDSIEKIQQLFAEALVEASENFQTAEVKENTTEDGGVKMQTRTVNGEQVVWIENSGFTNKQLHDYSAIAEFIAEHIGDYYTIIESGQNVYIGEDLPNEYTHSKYTSFLQKKKPALLKAKNRASSALGEMIEIATNRRWEPTDHKASKDAKYGMYRYDTKFAFPIKDQNGNVTNVKAYDAELLIRNASDGKKYLYDIVNIKEDTTNALDLKHKEARKGSYKATTQGDVINDNVAQDTKYVKSESSEALDLELDTKTESVAPSVMNSERTWTESDYVQEREQAAKEISKAIGVSVKKAKAYIDSVNSIAKMIAEDRVRLDYFSSPGRSSFVGNVEYGGSFDFSTLCKKRRLLTGTFTAIQKALPNTALTADEILKIRDRMKKAGLEVSCGLCYVEGSRANMGQFAKEFLKLYKQYYPDAWQPNMADVNTPDGIEWVRINHPECYEQYEYFWNHYGTLKPGDKNLFASQQKPKLYQLHTEYKGEVLEKFNNDDNVEAKNLNGGIRLQSFSDFEIVHLIDTMQIIMDMSRVGLAGQAYTKVPDFAWALGDTGLKINLSLIAKGVDENGKLIFDDVEGMPIADAMKLRDRYSKNVGTILVAFNDEQLLAAMADDRVDYIIPFHRSQWKKSQYGAMGLPAKTKDYTYMQNEKFIKPQYHEYRGRMVQDKATNYMPNEYWDFSKSGKENAEAYLEMCARNNKRPKFYKLLQNNGDGSYSLKADGSTDGYWKLLIDFKMYDNDGNGSPQMPVKPEFNMDEAQRMLNDYQGGHSNFPVAQGVVDEFVEEYKDNHKGALYSDRDSAYLDAVNRGDMVTVQRMVDEDAKKAGFPVRLFHGTSKFGFTKIDVNQSDDGISFFVSDNFDVSASYIPYYEGSEAYDRVREIGKPSKEKGKVLTSKSSIGDLLDFLRKRYPDQYANSHIIKENERAKYIEHYVSDAAQYARELLRYSVPQNIEDLANSVIEAESDRSKWNALANSYKDFKGIYEITYNGSYFSQASDVWYSLQERIRLLDLYANGDLAIVRGIPMAKENLFHYYEEATQGENVGIYGLYGREDGQLVIRGRGSNWNNIPLGEIISDFNEWWTNVKGYEPSENGLYTRGNTRNIAEFAKYRGYRSVVFEDIYDTGHYGYQSELSSVYAYFYPQEDIKSADPVTYDDKGNVIPLSERFNAEKDDIRYSDRVLMGSLFSGGGTLEAGLAYQMLDKQFGVEYDGKIASVYADNHGDHIQVGRVEDFDISKFDDIFYLHASPVCHNFSNAKHGAKELQMDINSAKATAKHLETAMPQVFTVENAPGYRKSQSLKIITDKLTELGYKWDVDVYNSADYGSATSRNRVILRAVKDGELPAKPTKQERTNSWDKVTRDLWDTLPKATLRPSFISAIENTRNLPILDANGKVNVNKPLLILTTTSGHTVTYCWEGDICPTLTTKCGEARLVMPDGNIYAVTPEFMGRIQGLPDDYKYPKEKTRAFTIIGNGIPTHLTKAVVGGVLDSAYEQTHDGDVLYQDRADESVSNRSLLANAFEGLAQNDIEKNKIQEYKGKIDLINSEEKKLSELNQQIKELSFSKGPRDTKKIRSLQFEANQTANRINTYDKQLLRLEASKPLQDVLAREKKLAYQKAEKRGKEALDKYKERAAKTQRELLEKWQDSRKKGIESREKTAMKHKIQNVVKELNDLLLNGDKNRHVPENLKKAVADALSLVNMDTVGAEERAAKYAALIAKETDPDKIDAYTATMENILRQGEKMGQRLKDLRDAYEEIQNSDDPDIANAYDPVIAECLKELAGSIGNTSLRDMSIEQLQDVYSMYKMVLTRVRDANKSFLNDKKETISSLASRVVGEVKRVGGEHKYRAAILDFVKKFGWDNMKPVYAFEHIGSGTLTDVFNSVRAGEDVWAVDVTEARKYYLDKSNKYGYDSWDFKKKYRFKSASELEFDLTLEQILSLYAYSKREQAHDHLRLGGFVFDSNIETYKENGSKLLKYKVNTADAHQITPEILANIIGNLTEEQKSFVDDMQEYLSTVMGAKGNEVTMAMYGVKLFKEKFYFPLKSAKQFMFEQNEVSGEVRIKNSGFTNKVVAKANNPVILSNFMDVWANHVNDMSMYHAFVLPLEDFNRVFNYNSSKQEGQPPVSVKGTIQNAYGPSAVGYVRQLITDLNGGARTDSTTGFINKMIGLFKKGSVFASLSVVVQQPSAIARAVALVDTKYFIGPKVDHKRHKALWDEVKQYAPVAIIKEMGYFDTNMGKSTQDFITGKEYSSFKEKMKALVTDSNYRDEVLSKAPALADELAWCSIWEAVKRETQAKNPGMDVKSESFLKMAGERFTEVITKTQVYDSVLSRSGMMRSKDTGMKMATAFMAEPTTSINMIADALLQGKRGNRKYAGAAIGAVIASQILNSILVSFVYAGRDDDEDETYLEKYIGTLTGEIFDSLNPATYIPFIKDIVSIVQGYDVERSDMAVISDLWKAWENLSKDSISPYRKVEGFAGSIAQIFGLPVKNIMRDLRAIYQTVMSFTNGQQTTGAGIGYAVKSAFPEWIGGGDVSKQDQLYMAYLSGDSAQIARVQGRFKDQDAIDTAMRSATKAHYTDGDIDYDTAKQYLVEFGGMEEDKAYWKVEEWKYELEVGEDFQKYNDFYTAVQTGKDLKAVIKRYTDNGVDAKTLASQITSYFKPLYKEMSNTERAAIKGYLLNAYQLLGYNRSEKSKDIDKWLKD